MFYNFNESSFLFCLPSMSYLEIMTQIINVFLFMCIKMYINSH